MSFLSIQCTSSVDIDLKTPIKNYIDHTYNKDIGTQAVEPLNKLNNLRKKVLLKLNEKSTDTADEIAIYHDTLLHLESRLPLKENDIRIDWKWKDILGKEKKLYSSTFERANLIYCYGAIHSQIAEMSAFKDLKQTVISYKLAFAALDYLVDNYHMFGSSLSTNTVDILRAYSYLMQAQVQECIFLKAEKDSMSPALVAKLASKTRECFDDALKHCTSAAVKPHIPKDWNNIISTKMQLYAALSHYYQAKACEQSSKGGERVAHLKAAYNILKSIRSSSSLTRPTMLESVKREHEAAIKDNQLIYHEQIPSDRELPQIPAEGGFKKTELSIPLATDKFVDMFSFLIPLEVLASKNQAELTFRSLIGSEVHRLREATTALNGVLVSLNLPAAIQLGSNDQENSSKTLLDKANSVRESGGCSALREKVYSLPVSAQRNREILTQQLSVLDDEEKTDDNLKKQFGDKWIRQPSRKLNEQWRRDIQKMLDFLVQTEKTDQLLAQRFEQHRAMFDILSKPNMEILAAIKSDGNHECASPTGSENAKQALAQVCSQIETLKADRESLTDQLNGMKLPDDVVEELLKLHGSKKKVSDQEISDMLNRELEGPRACVRASEQKQEELLSELQTKYQVCFGRVNSSANTTSLHTNLVVAVDEFQKLLNDVDEGTQFYAEMTARCLKVQDKIDDFCVARNTEKTEHLADLTASLSRANLNETAPSTTTTSSAAPPRPPPSYASRANQESSAPFPPSVAAPPPACYNPQVPPQMLPPGAPFPGFMPPGIGWQSNTPYSMPPQYPTYGYPTPGAMSMYGFYPQVPMYPPQTPQSPNQGPPTQHPR